MRLGGIVGSPRGRVRASCWVEICSIVTNGRAVENNSYKLGRDSTFSRRKREVMQVEGVGSLLWWAGC